MQTPKDGRKLSRPAAHRLAMLRNMAVSLLRHEKIETTHSKAKEVERFASKLITLSKKDSLASRRRAARDVRDKEILQKLFSVIGKRYEDRPGGYVKVVRSGRRVSDGASMAVVKLV